MSEIDANHAAGLGVDHEIREVAVTDAQEPVADAEQSVGAGEVGTQRQERLWSGAHADKRAPADMQHRHVGKHLSPSDHNNPQMIKID